MDQKIVEEIMRECKNWREKIILKLFPHMCIRIYKAGVKEGFNFSNKAF